MPEPYKTKREFLEGLERCIDIYDRKPRQLIRRLTRWKGGIEEEIDRLKPTKNSGQEIEYFTNLARVVELDIEKEREGGLEDTTPIKNIIYGSVGTLFFGWGASVLFARQDFVFGSLNGLLSAGGVGSLIYGIRHYKKYPMKCKKKQEKDGLEKKLRLIEENHPGIRERQFKIWEQSWY